MIDAAPNRSSGNAVLLVVDRDPVALVVMSADFLADGHNVVVARALCTRRVAVLKSATHTRPAARRGKVDSFLFVLGLVLGLAVTNAEGSAHASSCDGPYAFAYELVEVRLVDGMGDPASQTLWAEGAFFQPDAGDRAKFIVFTEKDPEGEFVVLEEAGS